MSNFLDSTGLELFWNKIKATFALKNHTHDYAGTSVMTAATASAAGKAGLVPAPAAGKQTSFLRGDGTWVVPTNTTYTTATTSANGLMSSADKTKLNGIAAGANKTTVDSSLSSTSTNPVQNKVIDAALDEINKTLNQNTGGQFVLPNGLKICWGRYTPPNANGYVRQGTVTFPITFSSAPYVFCSKVVGNTTADCIATVGCQNQTTLSVVIKAMSGNGSASLASTEIPINWIAIGY